MDTTTFIRTIGQENPNIVAFDDLNEAIMGSIERCGFPPVLVYDREKCIECFMKQNGWTYEEAVEWFEHNVFGAYLGEGTPMFFTPRDTSDIPAKLEVWQDDGSSDMNPLDPEDGSGWKLVSFNRNHINYEDPDDYSDEGGYFHPTPELQAKLDNKTAFILSYFEHGNSLWFRQGSRPNMPDMRWDGVHVAGILIAPDDWKPYAPEGQEPKSVE